MSEQGLTPANYHMNTLVKRDRYSPEDISELEQKQTSVDELAYLLDEESASVVDDSEDRDGTYDNAAAFLEDELGRPDRIQKVLDDEGQIQGFVARYEDRENAAEISSLHQSVARIPEKMAFIFKPKQQNQYDIKIE
jgi:hypothetical protein